MSECIHKITRRAVCVYYFDTVALTDVHTNTDTELLWLWCFCLVDLILFPHCVVFIAVSLSCCFFFIVWCVVILCDWQYDSHLQNSIDCALFFKFILNFLFFLFTFLVFCYVARTFCTKLNCFGIYYVIFYLILWDEKRERENYDLVTIFKKALSFVRLIENWTLFVFVCRLEKKIEHWIEHWYWVWCDKFQLLICFVVALEPAHLHTVAVAAAAPAPAQLWRLYQKCQCFILVWSKHNRNHHFHGSNR